jgi:hypothetical protein
MGADILRSLPFSILEFQPHEISKITAQLCIAVGRGHILVPKDSRFSLLDGSSLCVDDKDLWIRNWWRWTIRMVDKLTLPFHCLNNRVFCLLGLTVYISNFIFDPPICLDMNILF